MTPGALLSATAFVALAAVSPALGNSAQGTLAVQVTVVRSCAVGTVSTGTSAQVSISCSRGATPGLIADQSTMPMPMTTPPTAPASATASTTGTTTTSRISATAAAAAAVDAARTAARAVTPIETTTLTLPLATGASADQIDRATQGDRLVTINF